MAALYRLLSERAAMPFAWGDQANDCVSFAAAAVKAQTGKRVKFGGHEWSTAIGAQRVLNKLDGLAAAVASELQDIAPALAQRGDIAGVPTRPGGNDMLLMVVEGDTLVGPGPDGLMRMPRVSMTMAWSAE
ncbi:MAG: hypothetical protein V4523_14365 [Pseudomonadota bacterium]